MKVEIQQGAQKPGEIKYPCVMVRDNEAVLALCARDGFYFNTSGALIWYGNATKSARWADCGFKPATGPVTITLTNE